MASYLGRLNPIPKFPQYTGPHKVGTIDVELPVAELDSPSPAPENAPDTVQFRIYYPCLEDSKSKPITWLPQPQRAHVAAYTRFLGTGEKLAEIISFFPRLLHYISIPALKNAPLKSPTLSDQWPVMIFSHGLAGSRNAYSHLIGSIVSHGVVVIAPEHRDGSTPISYIRDVPKTTENGEKIPTKISKRTVTYIKIPHNRSPEVEAGRIAQLKLRTWELGCIHDSLLKIADGAYLSNLNTSSTSFTPFASKLAVHEPGSIIFAGHSFGAATVTQFVKSTFYSPRNNEAPSSYEPLFTPSSRSAIAAQVTPQTPLILLDMWCMPLLATSTRWLWSLPYPCYSPSGPGGAGLLAVESETFIKWRMHLKATKACLSADPMDPLKAALDPRPSPSIFYADASAHLNQSDFALLFPYVTKRMFACEEPERLMTLNVRAVLQFLRNRGFEVARTTSADKEEILPPGISTLSAPVKSASEASLTSSLSSGSMSMLKAAQQDAEILNPETKVRGWRFVDLDVSTFSDVDYEEEEVVKKDGALDADGEAGVERQAVGTTGGI